jgi:hypothetical protein
MPRRFVVSDKLINRSESLETFCSAQEMIEALQGYVDKYWLYGSVNFSSGVEHYYDQEYSVVTVEFKSPETDEEYQQRLALENEKQAYNEKREREEYERLKGKYGDDHNN